MTIHLVIPDGHAHWEHNNSRADLVGQLIAELQPDVVIDIGDSADMPSLSSYDKGKKSFFGRTYRADIDSYLDFQDRLWTPAKRRKRRLPRRIRLIGNHEQRILKAINLQPELEGAIGLHDLNLEQYYSEVIPYEGDTPGVICVDGINYAHYFTSGVMGRAVGGEHPATSLLKHQYESCTQGHLHLADWSIRTNASGRKIMGLFCGCLLDYDSDWAGVSNKLYWKGVVVKRNVEDGVYDPEFISLERLKKEYST